MASFIADPSAPLGQPYFYLIKTNTRLSLCLLSGLSPIHYSSLLLECQLVRIRKNPADGSRQVMFDRTKWIAFLERYELRGVNGKGGCAELTDGKIFHAAMFGDNQCDPGTYTRMPLLRVGKVRPENGPPSNTAINSGIEPPRLTHAMWEVKMKFIKATIRLLVIHEAKQEDVFAVKRWVLMPQNTVTVSTSGTKRKYGEKGQNKTLTTVVTQQPAGQEAAVAVAVTVARMRAVVMARARARARARAVMGSGSDSDSGTGEGGGSVGGIGGGGGGGGGEGGGEVGGSGCGEGSGGGGTASSSIN